MKKYILLSILTAMTIAACVKDRSTSPTTNNVSTSGDTLMYYWNFNTDTAHVRIPTHSVSSAAFLFYGGAYYDTVHPGSTLNGVGSDTIPSTANAAFRLRNPAGPFILYLPTTGYDSIVLKYAVTRTGKGSATNTVTYTTDGVNYINTVIASQTPTYTVNTNAGDSAFSVISFDFSSDPAVNNNAKFAVQINFTTTNPAVDTSGNDRFDNVTVYGKKQ